MKPHYAACAGAALMALSFACHGEECGEVPARRILLVVDSLGVDFGDSTLMFGDINGVCFTADTAFVVFDRSYQNLRHYSTAMRHIGTWSYSGPGPLEYLYAWTLCPHDSGIGLFEFEIPPRCLFLDPAITPVRSVTLDESTALMNPAFFGEDRIVGSVGSIYESSGSVSMQVEVCIWDSWNGSREAVLLSRSVELGDMREAYGKFVELEHCIEAYRDSLVFVAPDLDEFRVFSFAPNGLCLDTITFHRDRGIRSADEIQLELTWRKIRDGNLGEWHPSELEPGVTQLQVQDSLGLLWVCHGSLVSPEFTVFHVSGEFSFAVGCVGLPETNFYRFCISDHGYIAYTMYPADYPRLYLLELVDESVVEEPDPEERRSVSGL